MTQLLLQSKAIFVDRQDMLDATLLCIKEANHVVLELTDAQSTRFVLELTDAQSTRSIPSSTVTAGGMELHLFAMHLSPSMQ